MENVNNWHIFKKVCERTQNKLHSLIKKDGSQLEEVGLFLRCFEVGTVNLHFVILVLINCIMHFQVKIKSEPLSDEAYDDGVLIDGSYPDLEVCCA